MRQLMFIEPGKLAWDEIPMPELLEADDALVRPVVVARCDLDYAVFQGTAPFRGALRHFLRNRLPRALGQNLIFKKAPFAGPYPLGHECVAEVLEVGKDVTSAKPGQLVILPFQISCGRCAMCKVGLTSACESVPLRSAYGLAEVGGLQWGGVLNDCVRVPFANHMLIPVPQGLEPVSLASVADNAPDGYRAVAEPLQRHPGERVLIVGGMGRSVGLYAIASALALGARRVTLVDDDEEARRVAASLGATALRKDEWDPRDRHLITVDASGHVPDLQRTIRATASGGTCTSVAVYFSRQVPIPLLTMYGKGIRFVTGRINAPPCIHEVLGLACEGKLHPGKVTTRVASWQEAHVAFLENTPKVVVARKEYLQSAKS